MPSITLASVSAWRFHRNSLAWQIPVSAATTATGYRFRRQLDAIHVQLI